MSKKGTEFWDELGGTIAKKAKGIGEKAEILYETQKLRSRISGEERSINKLKADLGNIIYQYYLDGQELSDEQRILCEQIMQHEECIERYKKKMSNIKKKKICPSCKNAVDMDASFCPNCGAACPDEETEEVCEEEQVTVEGVIIEETPENEEDNAKGQEPNEEDSLAQDENKEEQ